MKSKITGNLKNKKEYHGIIVNASQKNKSIFNELDVIGKRKVFAGLIILYKIKVTGNKIHDVIQKVQNNMSENFLLKKQHYYAHFYRDDELIIVFREKTFTVTTDKKTWSEAIEYGRHLKISDKQLDFIPNRFEDETY